MIILSHRGYWKEVSEKNTAVAFERSFSLGFGTETDVRDLNGELVISHDPPVGDCFSVDNLFEIYTSFDTDLYLALNIKADGLQEKLQQKLKHYGISNYFVFDMSVPDALGYFKNGLKAFTRQSEYETIPSFYERAEGVWLDEFHSHWIDRDLLASHLQSGKKVCIVSPDLHGREYLVEWQDYKNILADSGRGDIMLCTDYPETAKEFFYGN
ncbi:MAG: hypothetical protein KKE17_01510 [Proteobacteria bacterium]|nr:hypothetical protein [Pseudomonadota bacterium]MBU1708658.1 hypothetical protein [Pseudomonadota bacterium]